ncbi:hypothetical protein I4U23_021679 [Adineta vaga]|nr:hypothetical protein I4U23_021679 [Adineta vaga]
MCSYESIKTSIRLLLTSASNGLSLEQLNADYQYYNQSENIPFANFGYTSLLSFIQDMSDIAQIDFSPSPPIIYGIKSNHRMKRQLIVIQPNKQRSSKDLKRLQLL